MSFSPPPPTYETKTGTVQAVVGGPTLLSSMTVTPEVGTFLVLFNCQLTKTAGGVTDATIGIYKNGTLVTLTDRTREASAVPGNMGTIGIITANGADVIDIRASAGTSVDFENRSMVLVKVSS